MSELKGRDLAYWYADKIPAYGDYGKGAAQILCRQADAIERKDAAIAELQSKLAESLKLAAAISRDCNNTALERNAAQAAIAELVRALTDERDAWEDLKSNSISIDGWLRRFAAQRIGAIKKAIAKYDIPKDGL